MRHGIREPLETLPSHGDEAMYINNLIIEVLFARDGIESVEEITQAVLDEWAQEHRRSVAGCYKGDPFKPHGHENEVAIIDEFVTAISKGLAEGDILKYAAADLIQHVRQARNDILKCQRRIIFY